MLFCIHCLLDIDIHVALGLVCKSVALIWISSLQKEADLGGVHHVSKLKSIRRGFGEINTFLQIRRGDVIDQARFAKGAAYSTKGAW